MRILPRPHFPRPLSGARVCISGFSHRLWLERALTPLRLSNGAVSTPLCGPQCSFWKVALLTGKLSFSLTR